MLSVLLQFTKLTASAEEKNTDDEEKEASVYKPFPKGNEAVQCLYIYSHFLNDIPIMPESVVPKLINFTSHLLERQTKQF
jgi:hypothetical protein